MRGYTIRYSHRFKRQFKKLQRSGRSATRRHLRTAIEFLLKGQVLPARFRNHRLTGQLADFWECHIEPDWLLLYRRNEQEGMIELAAMGNHSQLFD